MTEKIRKKLAFLKSGEYKKQRRTLEKEEFVFPEGTSEIYVNTFLHKYMIENERPVLFDDDRFGFNRTVLKTPRALVGTRKYFGSEGNITVNYPYVLSVGMDGLLERI